MLKSFGSIAIQPVAQTQELRDFSLDRLKSTRVIEFHNDEVERLAASD
jgi:hypothetical protein